MTEIDLDVFGLKIRIQSAGTYKKSDGSIGERKDGISLSANGLYLPLTALQLAGLVQAFAPGTDARKEAVRRVAVEQELARNLLK